MSPNEALYTTIQNMITVQGKDNGKGSRVIECQVVFRSGGRSQGELSIVHEKASGVLCFMVPGRIQDAKGQAIDIMAEHLFDCSAIEAVIVIHPVEAKGGLISLQ